MAYPRITCYPPLAQIATIPLDQRDVSFTVVIEWSKSRPNFPFQVCVLYDNSSRSEHFSQFSCLHLQSLKLQPTLLGRENAEEYRATFGGSLALEKSGHYYFTIKYRVDLHAPWQFVPTVFGTNLGELIVQQNLDPDISKPPMLELEEGWITKKLDSTSPATVFQLTSDKKIPKSDDLSKIILGKVQRQLRYFSLVRLEPYWLGPRQGKEYFHLSEDSILCSFLVESGEVFTILALNGIDDTYSVIQSDNGRIAVAARNDGCTDETYRLICSVGSTVEITIESVLTACRNILMKTKSIRQLVQDVEKLVQPENSLEGFYDGFTFCTWNALGQNLTATKILDALDTLATNGISISTLLIDDNWQTLGQTDYDYSDSFMRGFADFPANKDGFPTGLKGLILEIKERYPTIQYIGVWHALFGYWAGLARHGTIMQKYKTRRVDAMLMGNIPSVIDIIDPDNVSTFYDDFYQFLADSGITFVKTDVQHMLAALLTSNARQSVPKAYQHAWTTAYLRHFKGKAISCMSQIPQTLFHSLLQNHTPRILMRNSDDFYPEVPASHAWHIWANAHNALLTQHLNVLPDWDMFQTSHDFSALHAASRCISGGPILITDAPGEHDINLIHQITAKSPNGRTIALRPNVAKSMRVFDQYNNGTALLIGTTTKNAAILGVFNIFDREISALIAPTDFPHLEATTVLIRSYCTQQICGPIALNKAPSSQDLIQFQLPIRHWDILSSHPIHHLDGKEIAVLGLLGKMCGPAAVVSYSVDTVRDKIRIGVKMKALGRLGLWIRGLSSKDVVEVSIQAKKIVWKLETSQVSEVVEVDILEAWEQSDATCDKLEQLDVDITISGHDS